MWMFLLGLAVGSLFGVMVMALCAIQRHDSLEVDKCITIASNMAKNAAEEAKKTDDALGKCRAEGMWAVAQELKRL